MQSELVTVTVNGQSFSGWKKLHVHVGLKAAHSFEFVVAAEVGGAQVAAIFGDFAEVEIYASGDLVLTGFVDYREPEFDATSASITISGRSKSAHAVDCSAVHATGSFKNKTLLQIANELDYLGVGYTSDQSLITIPSHQLVLGRSIFNELEGLARDQGLVLVGQPDGSIKITNPGAVSKRQAGGLIEGFNIKKGVAPFDCSGRHAKYHVRGQMNGAAVDGELQIESTASDRTVPVNRFKVVVVDGDTDKTRVAARAKNHRDRAAGFALRANITTVGWHDEAGTLFTPGYKIWVDSDFLNVHQDMLIENVDFTQSNPNEGSQSVLTLVDARAYGGKAAKVNKSGPQWGMDTSDIV